MSGTEAEAMAMSVLADIATGVMACDARFTPDARWWSNLDASWSIADFSALLGTLHAQTVDGIHVTPFATTAQRDRIAIEATSQASLRDGRRYANRYHFLFRLRDGRIEEVREYSDTAHILSLFDLG